MAVTVTAPELAVVLRLASATDNVDTAVALVLKFALAAASRCVVDYAPDAPDDVHNAAAIRLCGWLYDAEPSDPQVSRALQVSGAQALLSAYRVHRAGVFGETTEGPGPAPAPSVIPAPPDSGHYILSSDNGALEWLEFPEP